MYTKFSCAKLKGRDESVDLDGRIILAWILG
jgi:hypothetical protein